MLVDKINFGLVLYYHANFYPFEELSSYWSVKQISVFSAFHWSSITVYNRIVTNTENTVHNCTSWFFSSPEYEVLMVSYCDQSALNDFSSKTARQILK